MWTMAGACSAPAVAGAPSDSSQRRGDANGVGTLWHASRPMSNFVVCVQAHDISRPKRCHNF